jgi:hypothetical protein
VPKIGRKNPEVEQLNWEKKPFNCIFLLKKKEKKDGKTMMQKVKEILHPSQAMFHNRHIKSMQP